MTFRVIHFVRSGLADRLACSHSIQFSRFRHSGIHYVPVPALSTTVSTLLPGTFALFIRGAPPHSEGAHQAAFVVCSDDRRPYEPASARMLIIKTALHARSCRAVEAARDRIAPLLTQEQQLSCPICGRHRRGGLQGGYRAREAAFPGLNDTAVERAPWQVIGPGGHGNAVDLDSPAVDDPATLGVGRDEPEVL
jgi:hypothetical protein